MTNDNVYTQKGKHAMNFKKSIALSKKIKAIRANIKAGTYDKNLEKLTDFERLVAFRGIQLETMSEFTAKEYHKRCNVFQTLSADDQILYIIHADSPEIAHKISNDATLQRITQTITA